MRILYAAGLAVLLYGIAAPAADPTPPAQSGKPGIRFPEVATKVDPPPAFPGTATRVSGEEIYVVEADVPVVVVASPEGLVTVTEESGPFKVKGVFVGGPGKSEWKTFKAKQVFLIEAANTGQCELLVIPVGLKSSADVVRKSLDVSTGKGPRPPPVDPVVVDPVKPDPVKPIVPGEFRAVFVYETSVALTKEQSAVLYDPDVEAYLNARCAKAASGKPEWRRWDKDVVFGAAESPTMRGLFTDAKAEATKTLPSVVLASGTAAKVYPLPKTKADMLALLKQYGGN